MIQEEINQLRSKALEQFKSDYSSELIPPAEKSTGTLVFPR